MSVNFGQGLVSVTFRFHLSTAELRLHSTLQGEKQKLELLRTK